MKYKVIKSAAHNYGHSFVSLMNYVGDDYVMSHLARAAVRSGEPELRFDLLTGHANPPGLVTTPVRESIANHVAYFPNFLRSHGIEPAAIRQANMSIRFELDRRSPDSGFPGYHQMPFACAVEMLDDRGKTHVGLVKDWWSADDRGGAFAAAGPWWKFWRPA